jgi:ATP-binding cassette, subfamily A (ABC1), member 3
MLEKKIFRFGIGYNLTIVKEDMTEKPKIAEFVKNHVPEAKVLSEVSSEASFQLPLASASKFKSLFQELDKSLGELGILSYGISITTLEEVFLKVAKENNKNLNRAESVNLMKGKVDDFDLNNIRIKSQRDLFFVHFRALIVKKLLYSKRDKKGLFLEMLLPMILMTVCCAVLTIKIILESPPLELLPSIYSTPLPTVYSGSASEYSMNEIMKEMDPNLKMFYHKETSAQQWDNYLFDKRNSEQRGAFFIQEAYRNSQTYSYISLFNSTSPDSVAIFINRLNLAIMKYATGNKDFRLSVVNEPLPMTRTSKELENTVSSVLAVVVFVLILVSKFENAFS